MLKGLRVPISMPPCVIDTDPRDKWKEKWRQCQSSSKKWFFIKIVAVPGFFHRLFSSNLPTSLFSSQLRGINISHSHYHRIKISLWVGWLYDSFLSLRHWSWLNATPAHTLQNPAEHLSSFVLIWPLCYPSQFVHRWNHRRWKFLALITPQSWPWNKTHSCTKSS